MTLVQDGTPDSPAEAELQAASADLRTARAAYQKSRSARRGRALWDAEADFHAALDVRLAELAAEGARRNAAVLAAARAARAAERAERARRRHRLI